MRVTIPSKYSPLLNDGFAKIIEKSGRSCGKSTTNECIAIKLALESKYNNTLYCRAERTDLRDIFNSTVATIESMGAEDYFKYSLSPFEITCRLTGAKIYFRGINGKTADDLTATKGFVPQFRTLALFIVDEANEVKCYNHIKAAETTANKFLLPNGKIIYAYNPPPSRKHWSNFEFPRMIQQGATEIYATWRDVEELLKQATIDEIKDMMANDPIHYRYWYEGELVSLEGRVIWSFNRDKHLVELAEIQRKIIANMHYQPMHMFYGIDSGIRSDATAVSAWGLYPDGMLLKLSTFYLDIAKERRINGLEGISHTDQVVLMYKWYLEFKKQMEAYGIQLPDASRERWCFDGAALTQDLMLEWRKTTGFNSIAVTNKDIERDNQRLVNSFKSGMLKMLNLPSNLVSVEEYENFSYDDNNEIPEGQSDHTIDADKYATYEYYYNYI